MPFQEDQDNDDDCRSDVLHLVDTTPATILAPYQNPPIPHPSPSQRPHATLPVSYSSSQTPVILGAVVGIAITLVALALTARCLVRRRRRRINADPFKDPPKQRFATFWLRPANKRLSDESWVSPVLPSMGSAGSPLSHDLELRRYTCPKRKLVPVTTPVCTPTDTEFGFPVPPVRVPSPVYFPPFSPSPSLSSSSSSLSPTPSTEPLSSPPTRLSRLLSSTFGDTRVAIFPARPSAISSSLYAPPSRLSGTRSRTSFYHGPWERVRDTISTVTTSDTDTVPHLHRAVADMSPFADPESVGTALGLKLRLSDASEHARYRSREREREREREKERRDDLEVEPRREFKLRDSESVLREIGW